MRRIIPLPFLSVTVCIVLVFCLLGSLSIPKVALSNWALIGIAKQMPDNAAPLSVAEVLAQDLRDRIVLDDQEYLSIQNWSQIIERASEMSPSRERLERVLAGIHLVVGRPSQAERYLITQPLTAQSVLLQAIVLSQQGRQDQAYQLLDQMPGTVPMLESNGQSAYWAGRRSEARELLELAVEIAPNLLNDPALAYKHLSSLNADESRFEQAAGYARQWLDAAPNDPDARVVLAAYLIQADHPEDAYGLLKAGQPEDIQNHPLYARSMGRIYDLRGDYISAISWYEQAWNQSPSDPYINWYLGQALYRNGQSQEAVTFLNLAQQSDVPKLQLVSHQLLDRITQDSSTSP